MNQDNIQDIYKLSPIQQGMLFHNLYTPASGVYFEQFSWAAPDLDIEAFERAWQQAVDRHPILRTSFFWEDLDEPLQLVHRRVTLPIERYSWIELSPEEQAERLPQFLRDDRARGFELSQAPLMRLSLIQLDQRNYQITWSYHHLLLDGWSVALLMEEVFAIYNALRKGETPRVPRRRPYRDYVQWLSKQDSSAAEEFWRDMLRGFSTPTRMRLERVARPPAPDGQDYTFRQVALPQPATEALQALARQERITLNTIVQGAWAILLSRHSGDNDLVYGVTVAGRPPELTGFESMIGVFINTLPIRVKITPDRSLREWLKDLNQQQVMLRQHEHTPLAEVQGWSDVPRGTPLFETIVVFENYPIDTFGRQGNGQVFQRTNYPLTLLIEPAEELMLRLSYETQRFDEATIDGLLERLQIVLQNMVSQLDDPVTEVELLTPPERHTLLTTWNVTETAFPLDESFHSLFETQAARTPEAIAVSYADQQLTYAELNRRANRLARQLVARGVGPDVVVALLAERGPDLLTAILAVFKAGGAYLPLDPHHPAQRHIQILNQSASPVVLATDPFVDSLTEAIAELPDESRPALLRLTELLDAPQPDENLPPRASARNLAYVIYTSGSTGVPKGAMIEQRGMLNHLWAKITELQLTDADRVAQTASQCFDISVWQFLAALLVGGTVQIFPDEVAFDPHLLLQQVAQARITILETVPSLLRAMLDDAGAGTRQQPDLAALRWLIPTGEALPPDLGHQWLSRYPTIPLLNAYGPTECSDDVTHYRLTTPPADDLLNMPIGRPVANMRLYILDDRLKPAPVGVIGELYVGGIGVGRGYLNDPRRTAEVFVPDPFADTTSDQAAGARLYKTGDLAHYLPDGNIVFLGRVDYQVKLRGFRIELGEIESVLRQYPEVHDAIVVARADSLGDTRLVAYVVGEQKNKETKEQSTTDSPSPTAVGEGGVERSETGVRASEGLFTNQDDGLAGLSLLDALESDTWLGEPGGTTATIEPDALRAFMQERLPEYMIPSAFVTLPALPLTPNGKVDRKALPAPDLSRSELDPALSRPRTPTEEVVAAIWQRVLGIEQVGIHDSFFSLGGHSLLATQILSRVRETFQVELALSNLFNTPTVTGMAEQIDRAQQTARGLQVPPIVPVPRTGDLPISYAQQRLWFLHQIDPSSPTYNIPSAVMLRGDVDLRALERSLDAIVRRHEVLRTTFHLVNGQPVQRIVPDLRLTLPVIDLTDLPSDEQQARTWQIAREEARRPFDLQHGPVVRGTLIKQGEQAFVLLVTMHHIVSDGWSTGVLIREMAVFYKAFSDGQTPEQSPLPPLSIQYADYAVWQRQWLAPGVPDGVLETQQQYWKQQLSGSLPALDLPTDYPRPATQTQRGAKALVRFPKALIDELTSISRSAGATLFMTLLSGLNALLYRYTGQTDILIGTPIANRHHGSVEGLIGMFVNTLVLRTDLSGNPTFEDLLVRVRDVALEAYGHQDLPFEQVVELVEPERDLSRTPLFQVMFVLQNAPMPGLELGNLSMLPVEVDNKTAKFDISFDLTEIDDGIIGFVEYNTDLFAPTTIERMIQHFQQLLESIAGNPEQRIGRVPLLTDAERHTLLNEWSATAAPVAETLTLPALFAAQAVRTPDAIAVVFGDQPLTYRELDRRASQLAHYLRAHGVRPETRVGVCLDRSLHVPIALLGIAKAGGVFVPLDPSHPAERLRFIVDDAEIALLVTQQLAAPLPELESNRLRVVQLDADWSAIADRPATQPDVAISPDNLAYLIYTSGSTGRPKGVLVTHRGLGNLAAVQRQAFALDGESRVLQFASLSFDAAISEIFVTLLAGAALHLAPQDALLPGPALLHTLEQQAITVVTLPPSVLAVLPDAELPALRTIVSAGEACPPGVVEHWQVSIDGHERRFVNAYGPTENTVCATYALLSSDEPVTIGRPIAGTRAYILDSLGQPVPVGARGELVIGGVGVARGYLNRPDQTAEKFIPDPFSSEPGARLYRTGDLARWLPDGRIEYLGRIDQQVKLRGFRIELGEIEAVLRDHPLVREAAVTLRDDTRLVAYVVKQNREPRTKNQTENREPRTKNLEDGTDPTLSPSPVATEAEAGRGSGQGPGVRASEGLISTLRQHLQDHLPSYMIPAAFVQLDALPLTPSGKLDRRALPAPEKRAGAEQSYVAPRTELERQLVGIWQELLQVEHVGINDNFFDLGGHSLTIVQLHSACQTLIGRDIPMVDLFKYPTISALAAYLSQEQPAPAAGDAAIDRVGTRRESTRRQQERRQQHRAARRHKVGEND
ncbi:MAG TPA: amino acid adenylation domain-containing protein [Herpetosiphonaceae bacterium]